MQQLIECVEDRAISWAERIEILRLRCLDRKTPAADGRTLLQNRGDFTDVIDAQSLIGSESVSSWQRRAGLRTRARLEALPFAVDDLEMLAGRPDYDRMAVAPDQLVRARQYLAPRVKPGGQTGHCALHLEPLLSDGIRGIVQTIERRLALASDDEMDTLLSFLDVLDGLSILICHAGEAAAAAAAAAPNWRRAELEEMSAGCTWISQDPPRTFREAIQLLWLVNLSVEYGDNASLVCPGRLDRILRPFYEADCTAGRLDRDEVLMLIESLYLLINHFVADGLAVAVMVGGTDTDGADVTHELSFLCLEALRRTRLVYPTVGVCWHPGTPPDLTRLATELIASGISTPAFFNDPVIRHGLEHYGIPRDESWHYINSTCVEITPVGRSNVWVASPYFSLCHHLLEEIDAQAQTVVPTTDFPSFLSAYHERLSAQIAEAVQEQQRLREERRVYGRKPLQSVFTRDCIGQACDIDDGGALSNWIECSFVGLANLADSLAVIRTELFDRQTMDFASLKAILDADFTGWENVWMRFLNDHPKYGNAEPEVDSLVEETVQFLIRECARHTVAPDQSPFIPGTFCWIMHERLGSQCGATPDGRRGGTPFADGGGPAQGRERSGPTRSILSTTGWDHHCLIGGLAYNMKFSSSLFTSPVAVNSLHDLVITYLSRGGFETQINVVSRERLEDAERHPEQYRDLVVRIGGYTDYFTRLSPEMRREIMSRTEYAV
ncbi:MAG: pyruvate formate lyase family protein [Bacillota bacterium]|nr:pyruvate formate lyase family protein [Bacillota bacterium]